MPSAEALAWARQACPELDPTRARPLPPAGSARTLTRLFHPTGSVVLVENPLEITAAVNENDSFVYLAAHLAARAIPASAVLQYERLQGWLLVTDLGDRDLCAETREALRGPGRGRPEDETHVEALYREALTVLLRLQVEGADGFDRRCTHNPPRYDVTLMRESESGYFVRELIVNRLGLTAPPGTDDELERLALRAAQAGAPYLLHRDYQSQNLKLHRGRIHVIDFQGARFGPPQYDVASLLLDPYVELPPRLRERLLANYLEASAARTGENPRDFLRAYPVIAAHRLMQALGAYAFLGLRRSKPAFLAHIPAALRLLEETLSSLAGEAPLLLGLIAAAREREAGLAAGPGS